MALISGLLLDTHTWLWQQNQELKLSQELQHQMEQAAMGNAIFVSSFSFYEVANAVRKKRLHLRPDPKSWFAAAFSGRSVRVMDITPAISLKAAELPASFHGDPGDRIITATAIVGNLTLLTNDTSLLRFGKQGLMKVIKVTKTRSAEIA
jgi:PIN domain nuclease of toxin-antitoxin system